MNNNIKVSVITSVYNGDKYIHNSVCSVLNQTLRDFEFIIINDGSTDNTRQYLESIHDKRVKIIHQENAGIPTSLNKAISISRGEYIARLDADDVSISDRLEKQVNFLEEYKEYIMVGSNATLIDENNEQIGIYQLPLKDTEIRWAMLFRNPFCHSSIMMRGDTVRRYNIRYNDKIKTAQDYEYFSKLIKLGKVENIKHELIRYRIHSGQIGNINREEQQNNALLICHNNLRNIGIDLKEEVARKLRSWSYKYPENIDKEDIWIHKTVIDILNAFKTQDFIDQGNYQSIKDDYILKISNNINSDNVFNILFSKLFYCLLKENKQILIKNISSRLMRKTYYIIFPKL